MFIAIRPSIDGICCAAPQRRVLVGSCAVLAATFLAGTAISSAASAQAAPVTAPTTADGEEKEIVIQGSLGALPLKDVGSVFGFNKTLVETPRSASTITGEQLERFGVTSIYDLVAQVPGTFTNSFFGVGGALDIRGTPGEVYFRGIRRLDNAGNYPTPIGSADRIDIVRGPASPIYGPSKTGGYINFVPKSARAAGGALLDHPEGEFTYTGGSWSYNDLKAQIRGPLKLGDTEIGYSLYSEVEDSGSYYRNMSTRNVVLQGAFDAKITDRVRTEFGGMYQKYDGQQNGGWNRLTQALVDKGTYITGAAKPLDTNGDGLISRAEADAANGGKGLSIFGNFGCPAGSTANPFSVFPSGFTNACLTAAYPDLALVNPGTAQLDRRDTLTGPNDVLKNKQTTGYFDTIFDVDDSFQVKNQLFYDGTRNLNTNAYGFAQFIQSYVIEDKIVADKTFKTDLGKFEIQLSPSIRYTNYKFGDDFRVEEFSRVDLTVGYTPLSSRLLSTQTDSNYSDYVRGHYTDYGIAALVDLDFNFGLDVILGGRYDTIDASAGNDFTKIDIKDRPSVQSASGNQGGTSWNVSASYKLPYGLVPYVTASRQTTVVVGEGAEIYPNAIASIGTKGGGFLAASKLYEGGLKGSWLGGKLYAAFSIYDQKRTDFSVQSAVTNQSVETKGIEFETRWSVDRHLLVTAAYTQTKVYNLTFSDGGTAFSFFGIGDLPQVNPTLFQGGQLEGLLLIPNAQASRRAGIPENLESATATYKFDNGLAFNASVTHVQSVFSGQSQAVRLPAYTLLDLGASYERDHFLFRVVVKNATDAVYYRANFTELFGSTIVLPERPRNFQASVTYKF